MHPAKRGLYKGAGYKEACYKRRGRIFILCEGEETMAVLAKALLGRTIKMFIKGIKNNTQRTNKIRQRLIFYNKIV